MEISDLLDGVDKSTKYVANIWGYLTQPFDEARQYLIACLKEKRELNEADQVIVAAISRSRQLTRHVVNQFKTANLACELLAKFPNAHATTEIDEDWLDFFFDSVKTVSRAELQKIWAELLARKATGIEVPKKLIQTLKIIDDVDVVSFATLSMMSFRNSIKENSLYPFIYIVRHSDFYTKHDIRRYHLAALHQLGLIEYNTESEFVLPKIVPVLLYGDKQINLSCEQRIPIGNVRFTYIGRLLSDSSDSVVDCDFLSFCISVWNEMGIGVSIEQSLAL